jgi:hypothetical protein
MQTCRGSFLPYIFSVLGEWDGAPRFPDATNACDLLKLTEPAVGTR